MLPYKFTLNRLQAVFPLKQATSQFAQIEKFSLNFSSSPFVIRGNLLHP